MESGGKAVTKRYRKKITVAFNVRMSDLHKKVFG